MNTYLIYMIAIGETHREYARLSVDSLYMSGYAGDCHVVTDETIPFQYAPAEKVTQVLDANTSAWHAKRIKATYPATVANLSSVSAVLFLDCDTLAFADVTPLLDRIAAHPETIYVTNTAEGSKNIALKGLKAWYLLTQPEKDASADLDMIDSSGIGFVPTSENLALMYAWNVANDAVEARKWYTDASGLNVALIRSGRRGDAECMPECERQNGLPSEGVIVRHYVYGLTSRMPAVFRAEIEGPYLAAHPQEPVPVEEGA